MTRLFNCIAAGSLALSMPHIAVAQPAAAPAPGMVVEDASGGAVGTVAMVDSANVTVRTDKYDIPLPAQSFTANGKTLLVGLTRDELNAAWEKGLADAAAALVVGAPVKGTEGSEVGTIEAIDADNVTIKLPDGQKVQIPRAGIAGSANGAVIGLSAAQLAAQLSAADSPK
ncbi:MAG: hypothetical protein ABIO68_04780 [Sphingomicrobium sp.]